MRLHVPMYMCIINFVYSVSVLKCSRLLKFIDFMCVCSFLNQTEKLNQEQIEEREEKGKLT